jgi:ribonuclease P protein component
VPPRVAFAINRSVGTAVVRNRLRRRLRAAVESLAETPVLPNGWLLVGALPGAVEQTFENMREDVSVMLGAMVDARATTGGAGR